MAELVLSETQITVTGKEPNNYNCQTNLDATTQTVITGNLFLLPHF